MCLHVQHSDLFTAAPQLLLHVLPTWKRTWCTQSILVTSMLIRPTSLLRYSVLALPPSQPSTVNAASHNAGSRKLGSHCYAPTKQPHRPHTGMRPGCFRAPPAAKLQHSGKLHAYSGTWNHAVPGCMACSVKSAVTVQQPAADIKN
jgi:hypothetical protein